MPLDKKLLKEMTSNGREIKVAEKDNPKLGPLRWLPGKWENTAQLQGLGFNMMAIPFAQARTGYRVLMNQYSEVLTFSIVDEGVPNRGLVPDATGEADQTIVALEYNQIITQLTSDDSFLKDVVESTLVMARSGVNDKFDEKPIHHEPGLWIYLTNHASNDMDVARMGSIPHGNSFLAVGSSFEATWPLAEEQLSRFTIPNVNGIVEGGGVDPDEVDLGTPYFAPYKHFHDNPFVGKIAVPGFSGLDPVHATDLIGHALQNILGGIGEIKRVKRLEVDSTIDHSGLQRVSHSGVFSIPFVVREADTTSVNATFLLYEIEDSKTRNLRYFMQYAQTVMLDFINRPDGHPGRARWPHISINTLERVADASPLGLENLLPV